MAQYPDSAFKLKFVQRPDSYIYFERIHTEEYFIKILRPTYI